MATGLRRIIITALIGTLVGLGGLVVLLGRRPRKRVVTRSAASAAFARVAHAPRARRVPWVPLAVAAAGLPLMAGLAAIIVQSRDAMLASRPYNAPSDRTALTGRPLQEAGRERLAPRQPDMLSRTLSKGDLGQSFDSPPEYAPDPISHSIETMLADLSRTTTVVGPDASRAILDLRMKGRVSAALQIDPDSRSNSAHAFLSEKDSQRSVPNIDIAGHIDASSSNTSFPIAASIDARPTLRVGSSGISATLLSEPDRRVLLNPDSTLQHGDPSRRSLHIGAENSHDQGDASFLPRNRTRDVEVNRYAAWEEKLGKDIQTERFGPSEHVGQTEHTIGQAQQDQPTSTGSLSASPPIRATRSSPAIDGLYDEAVLIQPGDSLWRISQRRYGAGKRYDAIFDANRDRITDPNVIQPGQLLIVPRRQSALRRDRMSTQ